MMVELASLIRAELDQLTETRFSASRIKVDATAYRLGSVGEYANKLSSELNQRHPAIRWQQVYGMRNVLFHDYAGVLPERLWAAAGEPLSALVTMCRAELARED